MRITNAQVVELVDTPDLGSGAVRCGGSSPLLGISLVLIFFLKAQVVELVDTPDSGFGAARHGGSSPLLGT